MQTDPLDIFLENQQFTRQELDNAKQNSVPADRQTPAANDIKAVLNRIIQTQDMPNEAWDVLARVLKAFPPEARTYIYKESMKEY